MHIPDVQYILDNTDGEIVVKKMNLRYNIYSRQHQIILQIQYDKTVSKSLVFIESCYS